VRFFDGHLDLACLAVNGRDLTRDEPDPPPWPPGCVTFPALRRAGVVGFMGTLFTEAGGQDRVGYPPGDAQAAHAVGVVQLDLYRRWHEQGLIDLDGSTGRLDPARPRCILLMEGADPIRSPDELDWWTERGVRAIGLAWARGSRYAGGNATPDRGLTPQGRDLLRRMAERGIVLDISHLSPRALDEALALGTHGPGMIVASHSNCRSCLSGVEERHLSDAVIRHLGAVGGIVGLNLYAPFLRADLTPGERPSLDDALRHIERIVTLMGHARGVGLGTDLDGGFSRLQLPADIHGPEDLPRLTDALRARGWNASDIDAFAWRNWARRWGLPAPGAEEEPTRDEVGGASGP
jgi:membrane dipeptidase